MVTSKQAFLEAVETFLAETGVTPTRLGIAATGDPRFVFDLRAGRSCGLDVVDKVTRKMNEMRREQDSAA